MCKREAFWGRLGFDGGRKSKVHVEWRNNARKTKSCKC